MSTESPFYIKDCQMSYQDCLQNLEKAAKQNGFNIVHIHDMQNTFQKNNLEFTPYSIVELCNPQKAHQALSMDPRMGNMMPKEVIVFQDKDNKVKVMFMQPSPDMIDSLFPGMNIGELSKNVSATMQSIVDHTVRN